VITRYKIFESKSKKFKVGDKVIVNDKVVTVYHWNHMACYIGKIYKISGIEDYSITLVGIPHWFPPDSLDPADNWGEEDKTVSVKWFKGGKLQKESFDLPEIIDLDNIVWDYVDSDDEEVDETGADAEIGRLLKGKNISFISSHGAEIKGKFESMSIDADGELEPCDMLFHIKVEGESFIRMSSHNVSILKDEETVRIKWYKDGKLEGLSDEYPYEETYDLRDLVYNYFTNDYEDLLLNDLNKRLKKLFKNKYCKFGYCNPYDHSDNGKKDIEGLVIKAVGDYEFDPSYLQIDFVVTDNGISTSYTVDPDKKIKVYSKEPITKIAVDKTIDPYGEEDWELEGVDYRQFVKTHDFIPFMIRENIDPDFEMENVEDYKRFKIEKNVDYLRVIKKLVVDKRVTFFTFNYLRGDSRKITAEIRNVSFNTAGILMFTVNQKLYEVDTFAVDERKQVIVEEPKRRTSLVGESNKDLDPYGEEDWEETPPVFWKIKIVKEFSYYENLFRKLSNIVNFPYDHLIPYNPVDNEGIRNGSKNHYFLELDKNNHYVYLRIGYMGQNGGYEYFIEDGYDYLGDLEEWIEKQN
jgi:hypothetical protein